MKKKTDMKTVYSAVSVPKELKVEFRKICILQDIKPSDVMKKLVSNWCEKEKKKQNFPLVANG